MATEQDRITKLESEVKETREEVVGVKLRLAVAESDIKGTKEQLKKIDGNTTWTMRIIIAALIYALLDSVMKGGVL